MNKPIRILSAAISLIAAVALAPSPASAEESVPAGDLYAFAVRGTSCDSPGYVHINAAQGVTWEIAGQPVEVEAPSSTFPYPNGLQDDVIASALPGYHIDPGVQSSFYLTVNPVSCPQPDPEPQPGPDPSCVPATTDTVDDGAARIATLERVVATKSARLERLREWIRRMRDRR